MLNSLLCCWNLLLLAIGSSLFRSDAQYRRFGLHKQVEGRCCMGVTFQYFDVVWQFYTCRNGNTSQANHYWHMCMSSE